jgi:capsular exopolysaccharide synthesis family protein
MKDDPNSRPDGTERSSGTHHGATGGEAIRALGYGESAMQRNFRAYLLVLRERVWYVVIVFLTVFLATLVYTLSTPKLYTAIASVEILARDPVVMKVQEVRDSDIRGPEDLNTQVKILESASIVQKVAEHLTVDETKALMAPYEKAGGEPALPEDVLGENRKIVPVRLTRILQVAYTHPDPDVAARVANLFVDQFMDYNVRWRVDESMRAVEDLKVRADEQAKKVEELGNALQSYRESQNMVSLDQRKDIVTEKLKALNSLLTEANSHLMETEVKLNQVDAVQKAGGNLADLAFVASLPNIQHLLQQIDAQRVTVADLQQRYRAEHPKMLEAAQSLAQSEGELAQALDSAAASIRNEYETAKSDYARTKADLADQEAEALRLDRLSVDYSTQQNELNVNQELLSSIVTRMRETSMNASIETHNARMVDQAARPRKYSSPNIALNLFLGAFGGLGLGFALAFFAAFVDDRVKSAHQIETVIGLPLIGIMPKIPKMDPADRAQIALSAAEPLAAEAFLTLHSNLRLKSGAKTAKVILVTSTRPGEGKSFVVSNLALTFAKHGERTVIVDCDLRKPNVHNAFNVANTKGVIDYCMSGAALDALLIRDVIPNLDILPAGGRATNPTHILNSPAFGRLFAELRESYDRILIDTPPLAPVSDAMVVLQHSDGAIYTIRFNYVRTKAAQFCVRRLLQSEVPCFGAVLNGMDLALSDYYYTEYYDKSYLSRATET